MHLTKLYVFDFDGTLYSSPQAPRGREGWAWYYHARSLNKWKPPGYDKRWHMSVVLDARRASLAPGAATVLLTARPAHAPMRRKLKTILNAAGIGFDSYILKPVPTRLTDPQYKARAVAAILHQVPTVQEVVMYDDLDANLEAVGSLVKGTGRAWTGVRAPGFLFP